MEDRNGSGEKLENIDNIGALRERIAYLQQLREQQEVELRYGFRNLKDEFTPMGILSHALAEFGQSAPFRQNLFKTLLNIGLGIASKKLPIIETRKLWQKALGSALVFGIFKLIKRKKGTTA